MSPPPPDGAAERAEEPEPTRDREALPTSGEAPTSHGRSRRRLPSTLGGICYLVVLLTVTAGIVVTATGQWRLGIKIVAGALGGASALRLVLPSRDAGMLAVRHRLVDVTMLLAVGVALWVLAVTIPNQPDA